VTLHGMAKFGGGVSLISTGNLRNVVHVAVFLLVLGWLGFLYYLPFLIVELWIGYSVAIWLFGPPVKLYFAWNCWNQAFTLVEKLAYSESMSVIAIFRQLLCPGAHASLRRNQANVWRRISGNVDQMIQANEFVVLKSFAVSTTVPRHVI
jgi:hypothetical protein